MDVWGSVMLLYLPRYLKGFSVIENFKWMLFAELLSETELSFKQAL